MAWRFLRRGGGGLVAIAGLLVVFAGLFRPLTADELEAHLAAGEFGPARTAALGIANVEARNAALGKVAAAQAAAGAAQSANQRLDALTARVNALEQQLAARAPRN